MRTVFAAALTATLLAACAPHDAQGASKFAKYTSCQMCVDAGFGWSTKKNKCSPGYAMKVCPEAARPAAAAAVPKPAAPKAVEPAVADEDLPDVPTPNVKSLTANGFDKFVRQHDVVLVKFFAPWCGHCKRLAPEFQSAAEVLAGTDPKIKMVKVDTEAHKQLKRAHNIKALPEIVLFRNGQRKMLYEDERTSEALINFLREEKDVPAPPPPEPECIKFDIDTSSSLMNHKVKNQVAFFYDNNKANRKKAKKMVKDLQKVAAEFAGRIIILHIAINEGKNSKVLGRFEVAPNDVPCMRVAAIYPDGSGMRIHRPGPDAPKAYQDRNILKKKNMKAFVNAYLAKETEMVTRSEDSTPQTHPGIFKDLIGSEFDGHINAPSTESLIMFHMENCKHCKALKPSYVAMAEKINAICASDLKPAGAPDINFAMMDGVKNEVAHEQVMAGSYPYLVYFGKDKENPIQVPQVRTEESLWEFFTQNTWLGDLDEDAVNALYDKQEL